MTQEEKAKAYDMAVERAKEINNEHKAQPFDVMLKVFPELKESEDERIRKEIIKVFKSLSEGKIPINLNYADIFTWLEKQGQTFTNKDVDDAYLEGMCVAKHELEKQGEQKPVPDWMPKFLDELRSKKNCFDWDDHRKIEGNILAIIEWMNPNFFNKKDCKQKSTNKVEPKFKVGDWVAIDPELLRTPLHIMDIDDNNYRVESVDGNSGAPTIDYLDNHYHLWTIQDAEVGDVLMDKYNNIGIYKEIEGIYWESYIYLGCDGEFRGFNIGGKHEQTDTLPATKDQRNLLFKKMKEIGYEWSEETHQLKKIEQVSDWSEDDEQYLLVCKNALAKYQTTDKWDAHIISNWLENRLKDRVQSKQECSKEDENLINSIIKDFETIAKGDLAKDCPQRTKNYIPWLKTIKESLQPKQEWSEEDEAHIDSLLKRLEDIRKPGAAFISTRFAISEDMDWLKLLKQRIGK